MYFPYPQEHKMNIGHCHPPILFEWIATRARDELLFIINWTTPGFVCTKGKHWITILGKEFVAIFIIRGHQITWYKTTKQQPAKRTKKLYIASQVFLHFCFRWQWRSVKLKIKAIIRKKNTPEKEVHCFFMLLCQNLKRERSNMNSGKKRWNTLGVLCGLQLKKYKKIFSKRKWNNKWSKQKEWPGKKGASKGLRQRTDVIWLKLLTM